MRIISDFKSIINNPDEFTKNKAKNALIYSSALKILAVLAIMFSSVFKPFLIPIVGLVFFSCYIDYKVISNMDPFIYKIFHKYINFNPYKRGYYEGALLASLIKPSPKRIAGFTKGFFNELFR